ncbi:hypothetical protein RSAG8_08186, partial [Rhizoctonia solani AG-8 WAC10335]
MSAAKSSTRRHATRPRIEYAPGGDLVLESIDRHEFNVHAVLLSLASPVFADMLEVGTHAPAEAVTLPETGEMVELMLKQLRRELSLPGSPISLYTHPLDALSIASAYGLGDEVRHALEVAQHHYDFTTIKHLMKLTEISPTSIPLILLFGIPSVKCTMLSEVLFNFNQQPMSPSELPLCQLCRDYIHQTPDDSHYSPPEWLARWAYSLFSELKVRPMQDWKSCFEIGFPFEAISQCGGTPIRTMKAVCACLDVFSRRGTSQGFLRWSAHVYDCLVARLAGLRALERLKK